ncbi:MAG: DUF3017 domain-containing protein [Nocardioides sp.]|nr:DUF3017 domain-containing protein [Nocardioides sp.]
MTFGRPETVGGVVYLGVLGAVGAGLAMVAVGSWRTGVVWMGAGLLVAATGRLVLGDYASGMLRVRRRRWVDGLLLTVAGVAMILLAITIPDQPG